jgi:hypothetical protein
VWDSCRSARVSVGLIVVDPDQSAVVERCVVRLAASQVGEEVNSYTPSRIILLRSDGSEAALREELLTSGGESTFMWFWYSPFHDFMGWPRDVGSLCDGVGESAAIAYERFDRRWYEEPGSSLSDKRARPENGLGWPLGVHVPVRTVRSDDLSCFRIVPVSAVLRHRELLSDFDLDLQTIRSMLGHLMPSRLVDGWLTSLLQQRCGDIAASEIVERVLAEAQIVGMSAVALMFARCADQARNDLLMRDEADDELLLRLIAIGQRSGSIVDELATSNGSEVLEAMGDAVYQAAASRYLSRAPTDETEAWASDVVSRAATDWVSLLGRSRRLL